MKDDALQPDNPTMLKPRLAYPSMYAVLWPRLIDLAREKGYALGLHGSLARDLDIIAAPWCEEAASAEDLVEHLVVQAGLRIADRPEDAPPQDPTPKPHGRLAWSLHLAGGAYLDLSVMPLACRSASVPETDALEPEERV